MKNILFLIIVFFLINPARAQQKIGFKSGANISTTVNSIAFPKNKLGWYAGAYYKLPLGAKSILQLELLYSKKGDKTNNAMDEPYHYRYFNFLSMPLMLGYNIDPRTKIFGGPEISYLLNVNVFNYDFTDHHRPRIDAAVCVGVGYQIFKKVGAEIRYNYGFKTFYYTDDFGRRLTPNGAHRVFQIGVLYDVF